MQAILTVPHRPHSTHVADVPAPHPGAGTVLLRPLEVGVCGTDREISEGRFGAAPDGEEALVLGHELVGVVERDGHGFARGDLVAATVRRSCGRCAPCAAGAPDACDTGDYRERGITRLHGFAADVERRLCEGPLATEVANESRSADLLVIGSRGLGSLGRLVLGAATGRILREATCPVLVVPRRAAERLDEAILPLAGAGLR